MVSSVTMIREDATETERTREGAKKLKSLSKEKWPSNNSCATQF